MGPSRQLVTILHVHPNVGPHVRPKEMEVALIQLSHGMRLAMMNFWIWGTHTNIVILESFI